MRAKANFTVFGRKLPSGKQVFYYQCYDENGNRQWAKSTGLSKKTEAVAYCQRLFRDGLLIPEKKAPTFAEFTDGWWDEETSRYLKWRQLHDPITGGTVYLYKKNFNSYIKDYFAKYYLDEITPDVIEEWIISLSETGLAPATINLAFVTLKIMMKEAVRIKAIKNNPCLEVKKLKTKETVRDILTVEEARKLFPIDWSLVWDNMVVYKAHRLAACTGLRIGELMGLRCKYVFDDYIHITAQYSRFGYVEKTKTKQSRNVPITILMRQELEELLEMNRDGYVFSEDDGKTPVAAHTLNRQFEKALERIGISREERLKRNLTFHAWRHFFNTLLRMSNVADSKVKSVTGHKTISMTEHYTHFDTRQFTEVRDVQDELLGCKETTVAQSEKKTIA